MSNTARVGWHGAEESGVKPGPKKKEEKGRRCCTKRGASDRDQRSGDHHVPGQGGCSDPRELATASDCKHQSISITQACMHGHYAASMAQRVRGGAGLRASRGEWPRNDARGLAHGVSSAPFWNTAWSSRRISRGIEPASATACSTVTTVSVTMARSTGISRSQHGHSTVTAHSQQGHSSHSHSHSHSHGRGHGATVAVTVTTVTAQSQSHHSRSPAACTLQWRSRWPTACPKPGNPGHHNPHHRIWRTSEHTDQKNREKTGKKEATVGGRVKSSLPKYRQFGVRDGVWIITHTPPPRHQSRR